MGNLQERVESVMPGVVADLEKLVTIPSCAFPGFPAEPVLAMARATVDLLQRSGASNAAAMDVPGGYPLVYATIEGPPDSPTVLLYAHYDVQPAPSDQGWTTDPWTPVLRNGRLYGRGSADDKSGIVLHAATLQAFGGKPPVNLVVVIEGEEETDSHLDAFVLSHPELFGADVYVIADSGNDELGSPVICTAMRGVVSFDVEIRTLAQAVHSGLYGGAVPDALLALIRMLGTLHDAAGTVTVPGLEAHEWSGAQQSEELLRRRSGILDGVECIGFGGVTSRLVSRPAITIIGLDAPRTAGAVNALVPCARATISLRTPPGTDGEAALDALTAHLCSVVPWGAQLRFGEHSIGESFQTSSDGPALLAALAAMSSAYGKPAQISGSGGSIPLLNVLQAISPAAEFVVWGAEDAEMAKIHSADESVDLAELQRAILAQVMFLDRLVTVPGS